MVRELMTPPWQRAAAVKEGRQALAKAVQGTAGPGKALTVSAAAPKSCWGEGVQSHCDAFVLKGTRRASLLLPSTPGQSLSFSAYGDCGGQSLLQQCLSCCRKALGFCVLEVEASIL